MNPFEDLLEVTKTLENHYVKEWMDQGKQVVGYVCSYVPEEIFYAADILPYRLTGKGVNDTSQADAYLTRVNCSFCRCLLELGFKGKYDFLEGAVFMNGCDHIRRTYDNWEANNKTLPFMYLLPIPHRITPRGLIWYKEEVSSLIKAVENHFGVEISPEKLTESIGIYNETRRLLKKLYALRNSDEPLFTGAEVMTVTSAATTMPKKKFNSILKALLQEADSRPKIGGEKKRLFITGSLMDEPEFIQNVEDFGAVVVSDALCFGSRYFQTLTKENGDAFDSLCERYYNHEPCPRMAGEFKKRLAFIKEQITQSQAEGVILENIKFCDMHGTENALIKLNLEKEGISVIELERQYGPLADAGRVRTRVQAFLEKIGR
jgi:bzd-type benzoyl-CoA reductase N subunit